MQKKVNQLVNNEKIKKYLSENNKPFVFNTEDYESSGIINRDVYALMMQFGIPVGIRSYVDSNGKEVSADDLDFDLDADHSDCKWIYTPINSIDELHDYIDTHRFLDFMENPNLISAEEIRHIAYLFQFADDKQLFDQYTMNKMQSDLIDNAPLNYEKAMNIFKQYYNQDVCNKMINDFQVGEERFYYLSGLKDNNADKNIDEKFKRINELGFKFRKTKDEKEKDSIENELKNIIIDLKKDAISKFKSESDIKKFLDNIINFNNYSFNNQILIHLQNPNAEYVSSFKTFSKLGYKINKGAKGIKVFIPNFYNLVKIKLDNDKYDIKPYFTLNELEQQKYKDKNDDSITFYKQKLSGFSLGNVFDISDTDMPIDVINQELNPILEDKKADEIMDCFIKTIYNDGFKVKFNEIEGGAKGYCDHAEKTIVVRKGLGSLMQLKVLIHEYGHALAHKHLENNNKEYQEHRNKYETEAESISYVVSKYLGMNTCDYSLSYLYAWSKEKDFKEIDDSLSTIVNFSKKIISNFEKFYNREFGLYSDELNSVSV